MTIEELVQKYVDKYGALVTEFEQLENPTQQDFEEVMEVIGERATLPIWHNDVDGFVSDITDGDFIREASPVVQGELTDMLIDVASRWARIQAAANSVPAETLQQQDSAVLAHRFERRIARLANRRRTGAKLEAMKIIVSALRGEEDAQEGLDAIGGRTGAIWQDAQEILSSQ